MSIVANWLNDLALLPDVDMDTWKPFTHGHEATQLTIGTVQAELVALGAVTGWLEEPSAVTELKAQAITCAQLPLAAEVFHRDDEVLHCWQLRHHGNGLWLLHHHTLKVVAAIDANCLAQRTSQRHAKRLARLAYWKLWRPDESTAPQCTAALLCAIEEASA